MGKDKIRVAVIGNGIIGESHISTYRSIPEAEVAAICDINEARLNEIGDRYGIARRFTHIGKLLLEDDIDAVDVCLHNNMHAPVSIAVMRSGRVPSASFASFQVLVPAIWIISGSTACGV